MRVIRDSAKVLVRAGFGVASPCHHGDMAKNAPGKHYRKGITLTALFDKFPTDAAAQAWFAEQRWPDGPICPHCGHADAQTGAAHKTMPYRCRGKDCRKRFSVKVGTVMEASNVGYRLWAIAIYLVLTNLKGISAMKLHRELGVTQSTAWFMLHRIREAFADGPDARFMGPVEVDETYVGGKAKNIALRDRKRRITGRGAVDEAIVVGVLDRPTGQVVAGAVHDTTSRTLTGIVHSVTADGATVFSDEHRSYRPLASLGYCHEAVMHSASEYVRGDIHTNSIESLRSMFKRGYLGPYNHMSRAHLGRYVNEFAGRHNVQEMGTEQQMETMVGKRLRYDHLVAVGPVGTAAEPDRSEPW